MRRYWLPKDAVQGEFAHFESESFHHIFDVCRQEKGSRFEILTGDQKAHLIEVLSVSKKSAEGQIISTREVPPLSRPHLHLVLSIPRFPVMEAVIEKAVEMGVHTLHPVFSDFSFVRRAAMLPESKLERWQRIVVSATQQCGRGELMPIDAPQDLTQILKSINRTKGWNGLFAYEGLAQASVREYLRTWTVLAGEAPSEIWLFVGSEGGFSAQEVQLFKEVGLDPVSLGEQVLRVETACIALVAILKYEFSKE